MPLLTSTIHPPLLPGLPKFLEPGVLPGIALGGGALLLAAVLVAALTGVLRRGRTCRLNRDAHLVEITPPPEADPTGAAAVWGNLMGLLRPAWRRRLSGQPHLAWEYVFTPEGIRMRVWVPGPVSPHLVARAIDAAWPGVTTHITAAAPPVPPDAAGVGGQLTLARPDHLPLRSAHDADPLRALLGATARMPAGEQACVQILARPAAGRRLAHARQDAADLRGATPNTTRRGAIFDLVSPTAPPVRSHPRGPADPGRAAEARTVLDKATQPRYACAIRYAVTTTSPTTGDTDRLRGRAHAIAAWAALYAGHNHLDRRRLHTPARTLARRPLARGYLLSVPELAALAHLPLDDTVPGLTRAGARPIPPPASIPTPGRGAKPLGDADSGARRPVALTVADARHHTHLLGATGSGKTTLLAHLALADAAAHRGCVVIDPNGAYADRVLANLPETAARHVVRIDPAAAHQPTLNPLHTTDPDVAVDNLVGICRRIWPDSWGPRTDDILRSACLTLARHPAPAGVGDVPRLLTEPTYRRRITTAITDPVLRGFWAWYDAQSPQARAAATAPLLNKLRAVLLRPFARALLAPHGSPLNIGRVLDRGGLAVVRIPKGTLGVDTSRLVGSLVLAAVWQAATHRARIGEHARVDAACHIDECHEFLNLPYPLSDMLAEARGYRLALTLAHQDLAQLPPALREAISANARNKIIFACSPEDARALERHTLPNLRAHDLAHLDAYQAAARLLTDATPAPAFTLRTRPLPTDAPTVPL